jgi:hypothetical protein
MRSQVVLESQNSHLQVLIVSERRKEVVVVLYVFGICERCKEPLELRLKYVKVDKSADVTTRLVLYHRPKSIGSACACGGRIRIASVTKIEDVDARTVLPLELWQMLYEEGMSLRGIASAFNTVPQKVRSELTARRHKIQVVPLRPVGRPRKSTRMEV